MPLWSKMQISPGCSSLSARTYISLADVQKFITIKPFILSKRVNNRRKGERVFYNYCTEFLVRFQTCQRQNWIFWLLLVVKSDLTSVSEIFVLKIPWWIQGWTPVVALQHHDGAFIYLVSLGLYWGVIPLTPKLRGYNPEAAINSFESQGKPSRLFRPLERNVIIAHPFVILLCQSWPW
jgi:hypothetical protein